MSRECLAFGLFGALGLGVALYYYDSAHPMALIDMRVPRSEVLETAREYARARGLEGGNWKCSVVFRQAWLPTFYIERTLGLSAARDYANGPDFYLWFWWVRFFKPLSKEEYQIWVGPDGGIGAFSHIVPEDLKRASLPEADAYRLATDFLSSVHGIEVSGYELVHSHEEKMANRVDHCFKWKKRGSRIADADVRVRVDVRGDRVGHCAQYMKVPEEFERTYWHERAGAAFLDTVAEETSIWVAIVCMAALMLPLARRRLVRWKACLTLAAALMIVSTLNDLNGLPAAKARYPTTSAYPTYLAHFFWHRMTWAFEEVLVTVLLAVVAVQMWKYVAPRCDKITGYREDRTIGVGLAFFRGSMLALAVLGYQTAFYLLARHWFGAWAPLRCSYSNEYDSLLPFMSPLYTGLWAGVNEEVLFRFFAIAALAWWTRSRWLAVLIPAALWGFAHSNYVTSPVYLRGIELTLAGVVMGLALLRYDLLTLVTCHYAWGAVVMAMPLLRSSQPSLVCWGALAVGLPLIPMCLGLWRWLRRREELRRIDAQTVTFQTMDASAAQQAAERPRDGMPVAALRELRSVVDNENGLAIVALCDGELAGHAAATDVGEGQARVTHFTISARYRRRYWGSQMWDEMAARLKEGGVTRVSVECDESDLVARRFWDFQGFRPSRSVLSVQI